METSAKTAMNVNEIFLAIGKLYTQQFGAFYWQKFYQSFL